MEGQLMSTTRSTQRTSAPAGARNKGGHFQGQVHTTYHSAILIMMACLTMIPVRAHGQAGGGEAHAKIRGEAVLQWVAPGNDGNVGTASSYDLRYSTKMITAANFDAATKAATVPIPLIAGTTQGCTIDRLNPNQTYYFAIKTVDSAGNWSALSRILTMQPQPYLVGNVNSDGVVNVGDIIYMVDYVFGGGKDPVPFDAADTNDDGKVNVGDIGYLIMQVFPSRPVTGASLP
jgi:hypothetical protein